MNLPKEVKVPCKDTTCIHYSEEFSLNCMVKQDESRCPKYENISRTKLFLKNHEIDDGILLNFLDIKLYDQALKEIPRIIHDFKIKIIAMENLAHIIELERIDEDKKLGE